MKRIQVVASHLDGGFANAHGMKGQAVQLKVPIRVVVTGAAGQLAYSLIFMIACGQMLGPEQPVELVLLDIPRAAEALKGVEMELEDGAFPLVRSVVGTVDVDVAFRGAQVACLVGAFPRQQGMERKDLLAKNLSIFKEQGQALGKYAAPDVRVVVVGNPANTNALVVLKYSNLPPTQVTALTRLDHNRAIGALATKLGVPPANVRNVIIWGNHSSTLYPDVSQVHWTDDRGTVHKDGGQALPLAWLRGEFVPLVQQRGAAVIKARKASSAASAARAVCDHMRSWMLGTAPGEIVSMAVVSDGSYGIERGLVYSFPVTCSRGAFSIIQNLPISDYSRSMMNATMKELVEERDTAFSL